MATVVGGVTTVVKSPYRSLTGGQNALSPVLAN
jgi:hypothetical protein